jgi:hypothetical protein
VAPLIATQKKSAFVAGGHEQAPEEQAIANGALEIVFPCPTLPSRQKSCFYDWPNS